MVAQTFYVEDTCALKSDPSKIGQVDRTFADVSTHRADPLHSYPHGIDYSKRISRSAFREFRDTGIPPRRTVLVTWTCFPWKTHFESTLLHETELVLIDRCLIVGDVVKWKVEDALSGTVIQTNTYITLLQPVPWRKATSTTVSDTESEFGNYSNDKQNLLKDVSTDDLMLANRWNVGHFVIYKDWVGKIESIWEDVYVRLSNGSVVVVDEPDELESGMDSETLVVGDFVRTKKGNLRRGRWIYGLFDPAIEPVGYIADIRATTLEVDWLCSRFPAWSSEPSQEPPYEIDQDLLDSGEIHLYDRRCLPASFSGNISNDAGLPTTVQTEVVLESIPTLRRIDLDACAGDAVRFRDIAGAAVKYNGEHVLDKDTTGVKMNRISRMNASGYDINVFQVVQTRTTATILWQDMTVSRLPSTKIIPYIDVGGDDEMWPGELVATRTSQATSPLHYEPQQVGIIQSVNAQDRLARIKWFPDGALTFTQDDDPVLMVDSITGRISETSEEVSLYDVRTLPGLSRRLGDYVVIQNGPSKVDPHPPPVYQDTAALVESTSSKDWFGEVIELGLDGLLTVRLGASSTVRDVKVPWECTYLVYSSDFEDDEHDDDYGIEAEEEMDDEDEDLDDDHTSSATSELVQIQGSDGIWRDVTAGLDDEDMEDWTTEQSDDEIEKTDESGESHGSGDEDAEMQDIDDPLDEEVEKPDPASNSSVSVRPSFSYGTMFKSVHPDRDTMSMVVGESETPTYVPETFAILETQPPRDHHYSGRVAHHNGQQLKRIQKEYKILQTSLPDGVYVRTWESALDLMRVLILGPVGTPYEFAPFIIDFYLDQHFPAQPPQTFFHSWTDGTGPVNPNLYEDGKICLSLLGTWPGDEKNESWSPAKSTLMQVIVSLLGLVLVNDPFYNEAGYESRAGTAEARIPAAIYSERTYFKSRGFIVHALTDPVSAFAKEIKAIYVGDGAQEGPQLLKHATRDAIEVMRRSMKGGNPIDGDQGGRTISAGALVLLRRQVTAMIEILKAWNKEAADECQEMLRILGAN